MNGWMDGWQDGWKDGWMDGWMVGWMDGWQDGWVDRWMNGWMDGWMVGWMDEWQDGWIDEWIYSSNFVSSYRNVIPHLQGINNYSYIAVLGRGHFGKVGVTTLILPSDINNLICNI